MALLANVALTNTFDTWRLRTNALLTRVNQFAINESALYANTLTANVSFTSKGLATFQGRATVGTNLTVSGNTTLGGAGKTQTSTGAWTHTGTKSISSNLTVSGNTSANKIVVTSSITGSAANATFNKATVTSALTVSGNTTFGGAGKVSNTTGWFGVLGRASISTNLFVGGNTSVVGLLAASGRATIGTNLNVSGNTVLGGASKTLTVGGAGATANMTGWLGITGRASVSTNLFVGGNTTLNGTTTDRSNALSQTLTDAATISWDTSLGRVATVTLTASRTMAAPTNLKVGTYLLNVLQGGTGSYGVTWNSVFKWPGGVAPVLTTTVGARDLFTFYSDGTNLYGAYLPDVK